MTQSKHPQNEANCPRQRQSRTRVQAKAFLVLLPALLTALSLFPAALQAAAHGDPSIEIAPHQPTDQDRVTIIIKGTNTDGCVPIYQDGRIHGSVIEIEIGTPHNAGPCTKALTPFEIHAKTTAPLVAGWWNVRLYWNHKTYHHRFWVEHSTPPPPQTDCQEDAYTLCLANKRFKVTANWRTRDGQGGRAHAKPLTDDSGTFWFFNENNVEVLVKLLNGCSINGSHWVYASGMTDIWVELRVEDTETHQTGTWTNPLGRDFQLIKNISTFKSCP